MPAYADFPRPSSSLDSLTTGNLNSKIVLGRVKILFTADLLSVHNRTVETFLLRPVLQTAQPYPRYPAPENIRQMHNS